MPDYVPRDEPSKILWLTNFSAWLTAHGGIPAEESAWTALEIDTESPIIHTIPDTTPTTYAYRARYVGKNLKMGPFGDPAVYTVSV